MAPSVLLTAVGHLEYAAAFFLLGGALKDAVRICLRQIGDMQLAIALARIVEGNDDGPVLQEILRETVVPLAFKDGNRWLASWAFWLLRRRDLAVRILVVRFYCSVLIIGTLGSDSKQTFLRLRCRMSPKYSMSRSLRSGTRTTMILPLPSSSLS